MQALQEYSIDSWRRCGGIARRRGLTGSGHAPMT
jgi:hypothetical protein